MRVIANYNPSLKVAFNGNYMEVMLDHHVQATHSDEFGIEMSPARVDTLPVLVYNLASDTEVVGRLRHVGLTFSDILMARHGLLG